jgi:hypothetical protein
MHRLDTYFYKILLRGILIMHKTIFSFAIVFLMLLASCSPNKGENSIFLTEKNTAIRGITFTSVYNYNLGREGIITLLIGGKTITEQRAELVANPDVAMSDYVDGVEDALLALRPADFDVRMMDLGHIPAAATVSVLDNSGLWFRLATFTSSDRYKVSFSMSINGGQPQFFEVIVNG